MLHLFSSAQNRLTGQWSNTIAFTNYSFTLPLDFMESEKNENHILERQFAGLLPNFWYHSKSRFGFEVGGAFINYSSFDAFFSNWVNAHVQGIYHQYYYYNRDFNFQLNTLLTYYVFSAHTWSFHGFAGYCRKFLPWRIPEGIYGNYQAGHMVGPSGNTHTMHQGLYRISAKQVNRNYHYRIGMSAVHNGPKRLVVFKCWYDLQPPARIDYRIEEISSNDYGLNVTESRKLDWFPSLGVGVEIHGFRKPKQKETSTEVE